MTRIDHPVKMGFIERLRITRIIHHILFYYIPIAVIGITVGKVYGTITISIIFRFNLISIAIIGITDRPVAVDPKNWTMC